MSTSYEMNRTLLYLRLRLLLACTLPSALREEVDAVELNVSRSPQTLTHSRPMAAGQAVRHGARWPRCQITKLGKSSCCARHGASSGSNPNIHGIRIDQRCFCFSQMSLLHCSTTGHHVRFAHNLLMQGKVFCFSARRTRKKLAVKARTGLLAVL
jgi:hypothetical protein